MSTTETSFDAAVLTALSKLRLVAQHMPTSAQSGEERSRRRGRSNELIDFRQYVAGDDTRDIDWNAVARHDELYTRIYAQEIAQPLEVFVDASPSMRWGKAAEKYEEAKNVALALAHVAAISGSSTTLRIGDFAPIIHRRGRPVLETQAQLANLEFGEEDQPDLAATLDLRCKERARALIVVVSDGYDFEGLQPAIKKLHSRGSAIGMIQVLSPFEVSPNIDADYTLSDGVEEVRISSDDAVIQRYQKRLDEFLGMWRKAINGLRGGYALLQSQSSPLDLATKVLPNSGLVTRR